MEAPVFMVRDEQSQRWCGFEKTSVLCAVIGPFPPDLKEASLYTRGGRQIGSGREGERDG